jgi:D-arabinose 1-dehydrogenase-like Zn-dependent alcohol dehydrogenase
MAADREEIPMKAYRVQQFGKPMAEQVLPDPTPVEKQVIVKVHACGLCHTDLHFHEGHINLGGGAQTHGKPFALTYSDSVSKW